MKRVNPDCDELLLALLDGPFKRLRDNNHIDPYSILVYDAARKPIIEAVTFLDLFGRYPCKEPGSQWCPSDFVKILQEKRSQYRKSMVSHEISDNNSRATPACGTVVLVINQNPELPHRWVGITALIDADP